MLSTLAFTNQQDGGLIQVICNKKGARGLIYCIPGGVLTEVLYREALPRGPTPYPLIYDL